MHRTNILSFSILLYFGSRKTSHNACREVGTWWLVKHIALTTYLIWSHIPPVSLWLTSNFLERQAWSTGTSYLGFHGDNGSWEDGPFHIYTYACNISRLYLQNVWCDRSNLLPILIDCCQSSYLSAQLQLRIMVWDKKKRISICLKLDNCRTVGCQPVMSCSEKPHVSKYV